MAEVTTYVPNARGRQNWLKSWVQLTKNIFTHWELISVLYRRDFVNMYKKSFLGLGWHIITPVIGIVSWIFMNSTGVLAPGDVGVPYPAYVLIGTTFWGLFMGLFTKASQSMSSASGFIFQVNFPHDILLINQVMQQLVMFSITFGLSLVLITVFGVIPHWQALFVPFMILPLFFLAGGMGLLLSVISIVAIDIQKIVGSGMAILMYFTPIIYSPDQKSELLQVVIKYNPLTYLVGDMRDLLLFGEMTHPYRYFIAAGASLLFFLFAWRLFYVSEEKIIEKMI